MGQRLERFNARLVDLHKPMVFLLMLTATIVVAVVGFLIVWYLPPMVKAITHNAEASARNTEDITGQVNEGAATLNRILADAEPQAKEAMANFVAASKHANNATGTVDTELPAILTNLSKGSGAVLTESSGLIADARRDTMPLVNRNLSDLSNNQQSVGKSLPKLTEGVAGAIGEFQQGAKDMRESPGYKATFGEHGTLVALNETMAATKPLPGKLDVIFTETGGFMGHVNKMGALAEKKVDEVLFPPPCKTKGCTFNRVVGYLWRPASEALRVKSELFGLPVNLMQPIRIVKQQ